MNYAYVPVGKLSFAKFSRLLMKLDADLPRGMAGLAVISPGSFTAVIKQIVKVNDTNNFDQIQRYS
jgi:hypothetical protein